MVSNGAWDLKTSKRTPTIPVAKEGRSQRRLRKHSAHKTIFTTMKYIKHNNAFGGGKVRRTGKKKKDGEPNGNIGKGEEKTNLCGDPISRPGKRLNIKTHEPHRSS